jgi:hypothetical protein
VDQLPEPTRGPVKELATMLMNLAGDNLRNLTVFGRAVTDDYSPDATLVRSVVVLGGMDLLLLDQLRRAGMRLGRRHLQAPLMMTTEYIDQSRDAFPLELLEIQQRHATVLGPDVFGELEFEPRHMRLQAERELKSELINLRQGLLASAGKDKLLGPLCQDALAQTLRVLRGVMWLKKATCPPADRAVLEAAQTVTAVNLAGLLEVCDGLGRSDFVSFQRFYRDVERLSNYVNHLEA